MNYFAFIKYLPKDGLDCTQKLTKGMLVKGGQRIPYAHFLLVSSFRCSEGFKVLETNTSLI